MDERSNPWLKDEHLCPPEIADAAELTEEVEAYLSLYNEIRPHEALGQRIPRAMHRSDPHLLQALSLQEP